MLIRRMQMSGAWLCLTAWLLICSWSVADGNAPAQAGYEASELPKLLEKLGSQSYADREAAEARLREIGKVDHETILDWGMKNYVTNPDPEVRYRLKEVIRELVVEYLFVEKQGYLGLVLRPQRLPEMINGKLLYPLRVSVLLPQTTAQLGDLQVGDMLVQVDDQPFDKTFTYSQLLHYIRVRKPGDKINLVAMRDGKPTPLPVTLGAAPQIANADPVEYRREEFFETWFKGQYQLLRSQLGP